MRLGTAPAENVVCSVVLRVAPRDDSLARVVALLLRKRWSILELHHRRGSVDDVVQLMASKPDGRIELLVAALRREIVVISAEG